MIKRIALVKPCCIGDVIFATPLLTALRRAYPDAAIDWVVGSSAISALRGHPDLNAVLDSGPLANPASRPASFLRLVQLLRRGHYDLAVVPDRSPLMGLAVAAAGVRQRAGLDSAGRGFAYTVKAPIDPDDVRLEAEIYLDIARALGISTENCWANIPPTQDALHKAQAILQANGLVDRPFIMVHPGGGVNAGMTMVQKRWPPECFAALADRAADAINAQIVIVGAASDQSAIASLRESLKHPGVDLSNQMSLPVTGAMASLSALYIGNDNGVAHLAAASGAKVLMIFGPSDPRRYAPFVPADQARIAWRPADVPKRGVAAGTSIDFDWRRDGINVDEAWHSLLPLLFPASDS